MVPGMIKPKHLRRGDTVAIVSLSADTLGKPWAIHKLDIARERLEGDYGLRVVVMPNPLKGRDYLYAHPEAEEEYCESALHTKIFMFGKQISSAADDPILRPSLNSVKMTYDLA